MHKNFKSVSVRVWPDRLLGQSQESDLLIQWEEALEELSIDYDGTGLRMELIGEQDLHLSPTDVALLICAAHQLEHLVVMVDVEASGFDEADDMSFRVHLDHRPTQLLCELYRRRVLDAGQMLAGLQRLNLAEVSPPDIPLEPELVR